MKLVNYIVIIFVICFSVDLNSQVTDAPIKEKSKQKQFNSKQTSADSLRDAAIKYSQIDTLPLSLPLDSIISSSIGTDTTLSKVLESRKEVKIAEGGLDDIIDYGSTDSSFVDLKENQIHLFGNAFVKYKKYDLKAGYIIFDFDNNEASAFQLEDLKGRKTQKPDFTDGTNKFKSNGLRFNFKTSKGLIFDAITEEGEFTIHGSRTKFVSKDADSTFMDDQIYNQNALITTCNLDHPHYGIHARKLKVVPNKLAIIGLSQLEIMGIPTPIILPFGFFPLVEGRSSGIIFPNNFEYDDNLGIGFREVGYYFPINDYMDLRVTGDIYTRGTHRLNARTQYKKRYKYNGNVQLSYANNIGESTIDGSRTSRKSFAIKLTHNQDAKAHPYRSISGNINLSTNRHDQVNTTSYENVVNNKISSNFYYKHSMPGTPFTFSSAFTHFQDNQTRKVDITLPDVKLNMRTIYPFKSDKGGKEAWYEKITFDYDAKFKNYVSATDTTLFTDEVWENLQTGLSHKATSGASFNVLKYFNVSLNTDLEQFVLTRTQDRMLDPELVLDSIGFEVDQEGVRKILYDTTYGKINETFENGLATVEKFGMNMNIQTQRFATVRFKKGWLRGLRHTAKPSIGFSYRPDTQNKYQDSVEVSSNPSMIDEVTYYNPYRGGAFNPGFNSKQMALTYRINSFFEGKYWSKADSTEKKFKLLNAFNIGGSYNFAADSLKFSPLNITGNTSFFKGITSVNFNARYQFYEKNENGQLINETVWSKNRRPVKFDNFNITLTNGLTIGKIRELIFGSGKPDKGEDAKDKKKEKKQGKSLADWVDNFRISHNFQYKIQKQTNGVDTGFVQSHSIRISGNIELTDSWNLSVQNISYDLVNKKFVFPQFSLGRDLHCWNMQFSWTPAIEVYSFSIGVKSSSLSFLKYDYGQRNSGRLTGR
ncbi:MAG: hypothetical protein ACJA1A_001928 [Saprospiraceae bacterium]